MKRIAMIFTILMVLAGIAAAAPLQRNTVAGNANWVFHFDSSNFWRTDMGSRILESMPEEAHRRLDGVADFLGTDPVNDIYGVTLYGPDENPENATAVIKGDFDRDRILGLLRKDSEYKEYTYDGQSIHRWQSPHDNIMRYGTFAASDTIIISQSRSTVERALDVFNEKQPSIAQDSRFDVLAEAPEDAFMVTCIHGLASVATDHGRAAILKNVESLFQYAVETNGVLNVAANMQAKDAQSAQQMAQVLRGMISMVMLNPDMAELGVILRAVNIDVEADKLYMDFSYSSHGLFDILKEHAPDNIDIR